MRTLSVIPEHLAGLALAAAQVDIYGQSFFIGLLDVEEPEFDMNADSFANCVLVKKKAFSLNFRDKGITLQSAFLLREKAIDSHWPIGSEFCATVIHTGKNVTSLQPGDRVVPDYSFPVSGRRHISPGVASNNASKEYEIFDSVKLKKVSSSISDEVGAAFTIGAQTAFGMIGRLNLKGSETVLVTSGTSATSLFVISALKNRVKQLVVLTGRQQMAERIKMLGATDVIVVNDRMKPEQAAFKKLNGRFDVIIDPFSDMYLHQLYRSLNLNGKYITCGIYEQSLPPDPDFDAARKDLMNGLLATMIVQNLTIIGNCLGTSADLHDAINAYEKGDLVVPVDSVFSGMEIEPFFRRSFCENDKFGKVVFKYD